MFFNKKRTERSFKKICVTGGAGFIGSRLVKHLCQVPDYEIFVIDSLTYAGNQKNLNDCVCNFQKIDIRDRKKLSTFFERNAFDCIIHLAAESHVDRSIENPMDFVETNVNGTINLLEESLKLYAKNPDFVFYHVSTDEVFGSLPLHGFSRFNEKTAYDPRSPYSASKASSDHFVRAYHHTYGLPVLISNCSNNYGTHQYPEKLIPVVIQKLKKREKIPVYGNGKNKRDWLHVSDHASAIHHILKHGKIGETYCVGGNNVVKNIDLVKTLCYLYDEMYETEDSQSLIRFVTDRKGHDLKYAINPRKLSKLGWKPSVKKTSFEDKLKETIRWYIEKTEE